MGFSVEENNLLADITKIKSISRGVLKNGKPCIKINLKESNIDNITYLFDSEKIRDHTFNEIFKILKGVED
jgi:hypothetical protein